MAGSDDSMLDKAEGFARRMLERLGAKVDSKLRLGPREISEITSRIEHLIESSLKEDKTGAKRIAPNRFRVHFTYEDSAELDRKYLQALAQELKATIYEYINNRRYETIAPIEVEAGRDVFAKSIVVKAAFEESFNASQQGGAGGTVAEQSAKQGLLTILLQSAEGPSYRIELKAGGAPACIGRAAGTALRIEDSSISRLHCSLALRSNGEIVVSDLGSSNGTYINEEMLGPNEARPLRQGDMIGVGDVRFTISEIS
ncbi:MAG: FHA domain-containing protein [Blastocatellia bacterium]|nr:FHA domain-containing protein [Blastocatellia bacterium]